MGVYANPIVSLVKIIAVVLAIIIGLIGVIFLTRIFDFRLHRVIGIVIVGLAVILLIYGLISNHKSK